MGICVVGAVFVDIKGFPFDQYIPDGRNAGKIEYVYGGVGRNVVSDIANVGVKPTFVSLVDKSAIGSDILKQLEDNGVNITYTSQTENGMGTWLAVFDNNGDLAGSISQRPDLSPIVSLLKEKGDEIISESDSAVFEIDIEREIVEELLALCKKYNKKSFGIVGNMSIAVQRKQLLKQFDCIVCNQLEAGIFFNEDYEQKELDELEAIIASKIKEVGISSMVVTMGSKGCVYASLDGEVGHLEAKKVEVVDTTGAGDAFCSGVAMGITYGKTMAEAVKIGTELASEVIQRKDNVCPLYTPETFHLNYPK